MLVKYNLQAKFKYKHSFFLGKVKHRPSVGYTALKLRRTFLRYGGWCKKRKCDVWFFRSEGNSVIESLGPFAEEANS